MKKTLRLLITEKCNRNCPDCCNKQMDLETLPVCTSYKGYDEIILTGGEPMLMPNKVRMLVNTIRKQTRDETKIYMYTAKTDNLQGALSVLYFLDGMTVTIHDIGDWTPFGKFNSRLPVKCDKSLRLNVFKTCRLRNYYMFDKWKVKDDVEWLKDCPLPPNEVFMRLKG